MIDRTWLGEVNYDYDFRKLGSRPNATAIAINGNDHYVLNTIVFASRIGVEVLGAANYISGTHVWFPENIALLFNDSRAFSIGASGRLRPSPLLTLIITIGPVEVALST